MNNIIFYLFFIGLQRIVIEQFRKDVIHDNKRNYTTLKTALTLIVLSPIFAIALSLYDTNFLKASNLISNISFFGFSDFLFTNTNIFVAGISASFLIFTGYGIHGKKLGTFPEFSSIFHYGHDHKICTVQNEQIFNEVN